MGYKQLVNRHAYCAEEQAIELLTDPEEVSAREQLLEALMEMELAYNDHVNNYNLRRHCEAIEARGLRVRPITWRTAA